MRFFSSLRDDDARPWLWRSCGTRGTAASRVGDHYGGGVGHHWYMARRRSTLKSGSSSTPWNASARRWSAPPPDYREAGRAGEMEGLS